MEFTKNKQLEYINIDTPPLERKFEYSKEYVLELKAIHQEEKNEMQQKKINPTKLTNKKCK